MESYLMGVDLGTTNVKAMIFDLEGNPLSKGEAGHYPILSTRMNWAEQDARVWWQDTADAIHQAVSRLPGDPRGIRGGLGQLPGHGDAAVGRIRRAAVQRAHLDGPPWG